MPPNEPVSVEGLDGAAPVLGARSNSADWNAESLSIWRMLARSAARKGRKTHTEASETPVQKANGPAMEHAAEVDVEKEGHCQPWLSEIVRYGGCKPRGQGFGGAETSSWNK